MPVLQISRDVWPLRQVSLADEWRRQAIIYQTSLADELTLLGLWAVVNVTVWV